jgi:2C-methyl-D-erythritol 2,4-cyclodiphosphate synthase
VSAAFAKVKGAAHACLGGQEIEVKTTVTFGSDGKVTKVAVANAPEPAMASCIEGAVGKATVPPFTDATFSAPLTVR